MLNIKMDKTKKQVTKDPERQEAARIGRGKYMNKLEENVLNEATNGGSIDRDTSNVNNDVTDASTSATMLSQDQ